MDFPFTLRSKLAAGIARVILFVPVKTETTLPRQRTQMPVDFLSDPAPHHPGIQHPLCRLFDKLFQRH